MINIGILGTANIARKYMIPAILDMKQQFILQGIASRGMGAAKKVASQFDIQSYEGYDTLIDPKIIDAIYIPLPNSLHAEWIEKSLDLNLHVLVEKPMGLFHEDVEIFNNIASEKNLALVENFQFRFHKQLSVIKKMVSDKKIGEIRCVRSSFGFPPFTDADNIRYNKNLGGGALLDAGAYPIKITQIFLGMDIEVSAANLWLDKEKEVDIWGGAYLKQKNGPLYAEIAFGFDNFYQCSLELWGSKGGIYTNRIFTAPPDFSPEIICETANGKEIIKVRPENHFQNMLYHFHTLATEKKDLKAEYAQNINQSRLISELKEKAVGK